MTKRQAFYNSSAWVNFMKLLKMQRMNPQGEIICEHCGRQIISKYDCIGHHIEELTDENVDDAAVALNPENVILIHFSCHNEIHKRFGGGCAKQVFIVYGAPCSGKSTWVDSVAERDDLIVDIDRLWGAVRASACGTYDKPGTLKQVVFRLRDDLLEAVRMRQGKWHNAYIVGGFPLVAERERLQDSINADKMIYIEATENECLQRAELKAPEWKQYVRDWFEKFTTGDPPH